MSHETHHHPSNDRPTTSSTSALWFTIILTVLFIAALNFVNVMSNDSEEHGAAHGHTEAVMPAHEATSSQTLEGETGIGVTADDTTQHFGTNTAMDTTHMEGH